LPHALSWVKLTYDLVLVFKNFLKMEQALVVPVFSKASRELVVFTKQLTGPQKMIHISSHKLTFAIRLSY